jgi:hypothetical protein
VPGAKDRGRDHDDIAAPLAYRCCSMAEPHRITLEIDTSGPPIHGRLLTTPDLERTFTGWTSLLAALDAAINRDGERPQTEG